MWAESGGRSVIAPDLWAEVADLGSVPADRFALAVDVSPDRDSASVALAGQRADGYWHVELDEQKNGVGWLVPWVVRRCQANPIRAVVIDSRSPAASIIDELAQHKIKVTTTGAQDMARACGTFYDGVMERWLRHTDQQQVNTALGVARKRPLSDAWAWNRKNSASDITPLVACTLALWGAQASQVKKPARNGQGRKVLVLS
jgi:phage terminase large subunit-like protein